MANDADQTFDFEADLEAAEVHQQEQERPSVPLLAEVIGQQPGNFIKNYRQTVCTYWLKGLCMKGDSCGFLHQFDPARMPVCRNLLKHGECKDMDCPYKHSTDEIKECNMFKLGFCIYGPTCRYKHKKEPGPPPDPSTVEAAKPRDARDLATVVNSVNPGVLQEDRDRPHKRPRWVQNTLPAPGGGGGARGSGAPAALPAPDGSGGWGAGGHGRGGGGFGGRGGAHQQHQQRHFGGRGQPPPQPPPGQPQMPPPPGAPPPPAQFRRGMPVGMAAMPGMLPIPGAGGQPGFSGQHQGHQGFSSVY